MGKQRTHQTLWPHYLQLPMGIMTFLLNRTQKLLMITPKLPTAALQERQRKKQFISRGAGGQTIFAALNCFKCSSFTMSRSIITLGCKDFRQSRLQHRKFSNANNSSFNKSTCVNNNHNFLEINNSLRDMKSNNRKRKQPTALLLCETDKTQQVIRQFCVCVCVCVCFRGGM